MPTPMLLNSFTSINNVKNVNISLLFLPFLSSTFNKKKILRVGRVGFEPLPHSRYIICHAILSAANLLC